MRQRMAEMSVIATNRIRCSFVRSKIVSDRRSRRSQLNDRATTQPMPAGTRPNSQPLAPRISVRRRSAPLGDLRD
jgi:hypothetical protein